MPAMNWKDREIRDRRSAAVEAKRRATTGGNTPFKNRVREAVRVTNDRLSRDGFDGCVLLDGDVLEVVKGSDVRRIPIKKVAISVGATSDDLRILLVDDHQLGPRDA